MMKSLFENSVDNYLTKGLKMPEDQLKRIEKQNEKLDEIIKEFGGDYQGTDPIEDRKRIYVAAASKELNVKWSKK